MVAGEFNLSLLPLPSKGIQHVQSRILAEALNMLYILIHAIIKQNDDFL